MTIGSMFGDVFRSLFKRPFTERYPFQRPQVPERLRAKVVWNPENCSGCQLCVKDCPANALELIVVDKARKRFVMRYHADRCIYCAQCVESCRFKCLGFSTEEWELASASKVPFEVLYGRDEDIQFLLERAAQECAGEAAPCSESAG